MDKFSYTQSKMIEQDNDDTCMHVNCFDIHVVTSTRTQRHTLRFSIKLSAWIKLVLAIWLSQHIFNWFKPATLLMLTCSRALTMLAHVILLLRQYDPIL